MNYGKKLLAAIIASISFLFTSFAPLTDKTVSAQTIPQVAFVSAPVTEYTVGDRVQFKIFAPNYTGKVEYRVVLWNDSLKTYYDLWDGTNGNPTHYYQKWQPKGNDVFTLGWPIFEPGSYRITVYVKRVGVPVGKAALKGMNCDSYMESAAFTVRPRGIAVRSIYPLNDIVVDQGSKPMLPGTVKALMEDGTERDLMVSWDTVDTTRLGTAILKGKIEGTSKKTELKLIINQGVLNVRSLNAVTNSCIEIGLFDSIGFIPSTGRFSIKTPYNTPINIYSVIVSKGGGSFQLITDYMPDGYWYMLTIDGIKYKFIVPGGIVNYPPSSNTITINAYDRVVELGKYTHPYIVTNPSDVDLYFTSNDPSIAAIDKNTGLISAVSAGLATVNVKASRTGYNDAWATFTVRVITGAQLMDMPVAYPEPGEVQSGTQVILRTSASGASIYYTLDGTNPTINSALYTSPIAVYSNTVIKAIAVKANMSVSNAATFVYTVKTSSVSTNAWLRDKTFSGDDYYYIDWSGPTEITLGKTAGNRRIITIHDLSAKSIKSGTVKNYGNIVFAETGEKSRSFTCSMWDGTFVLDEVRGINEHSIRLRNGSTVELRILNPIDNYPDYIGEWFK